MISYSDFSKLRLDQFLSSENDIQKCDNFEFMDDIWIGQTAGFTEWLQLESDPANTQSISLDLNNLPSESIKNIISILGLNIDKGMGENQVIESFGKPHQIESFVDDRQTFIYIVGDNEKYYLSLTIHNVDGLIYMNIMNHAKTINELRTTLS